MLTFLIFIVVLLQSINIVTGIFNYKEYNIHLKYDYNLFAFDASEFAKMLQATVRVY